MDPAEDRAPVMQCPAAYQLHHEDGRILSRGTANVRLEEDRVVVTPESGEPILLDMRDIIDVSEHDFRLHLNLVNREALLIYDLGPRYDDLQRTLSRLHNETMIEYLLKSETLRKAGVPAEFRVTDEAGGPGPEGKCEARLYETGLVIMPEKGELLRFSFSDLAGIKNEDPNLLIKTDFGERIVLTKMGRHFDAFFGALLVAHNEVSIRTQAFLKDSFPMASDSIIRRAARLLKEGRAAGQAEIEEISPDLWLEMEEELASAGLSEAYEFLRTLGRRERTCIGLKPPPLMSRAGNFVWFMIPIYSADPARPGNAVALEASALDGAEGVAATYFFKIMSRKDYQEPSSLEALGLEADRQTARLNRALRAADFQWPAIYLSDEALLDPANREYLFNAARTPALRELRRMFIGRVNHGTQEQWERDVLELLAFNVTAEDDETLTPLPPRA